MSLRTFAIFQDTPSTHQSQKPKSVSTIRGILSPLGNGATSPSALSSAPDKENFHPVTGERAATSTTKKRKTTALATKAQTPLATKEPKEPSESKPASKKRKSATTKGKPKPKKEANASGTSRKSSKKTSRRASSLPKVDEVAESEIECQRLVLADIDSRCYELTVQPLADVTQAYEQGFSSISAEGSEKAKFRTVKVRLATFSYMSVFLTMPHRNPRANLKFATIFLLHLPLPNVPPPPPPRLKKL